MWRLWAPSSNRSLCAMRTARRPCRPSRSMARMMTGGELSGNLMEMIHHHAVHRALLGPRQRKSQREREATPDDTGRLPRFESGHLHRRIHCKPDLCLRHEPVRRPSTSSTVCSPALTGISRLGVSGTSGSNPLSSRRSRVRTQSRSIAHRHKLLPRLRRCEDPGDRLSNRLYRSNRVRSRLDTEDESNLAPQLWASGSCQKICAQLLAF